MQSVAQLVLSKCEHMSFLKLKQLLGPCTLRLNRVIDDQNSVLCDLSIFIHRTGTEVIIQIFRKVREHGEI